MFREMLRKNQALPIEACVEILENEKRGVLSVIGDDGYPYGMPMNHYYKDGMLYFHCGRKGHRIDAIAKNPKVSYCVHDSGVMRDDGWSYDVKSVIIFGRAEICDDAGTVAEICTELSRRFVSDEDYIAREVKSALSATVLIRLIPEHISGKAVHEA